MNKISLNEMIIDKYYHCYSDNRIRYYFKYNGFDDYDVKSYGWEFLERKSNNYIPEYYNIDINFCTVHWINVECVYLKEISFNKIVKYFPDNHPEKTNYYRNKKINFLLNI